MDKILSHVNELEQKLRLLGKEIQELRSENIRLRQQAGSFVQATLSRIELEGNTEAPQPKDHSLRLDSSDSSVPVDPAERKKWEQMVKDLDACIAWMKQL